MQDAILSVVTLEGIVWKFFVFIGVACVFGLAWWLVEYLKLREPFNYFAKAALAILAVFILICFIMALRQRFRAW